jgi:hypothetical protein
MKYTLLLSVLCLAATALPGCLKKKVDVTFHNHADRALEVHVTGPGEGTGLLGTMEPGGKVGTTLIVPRGDMPVNFTWTAGIYGSAFVVWKGTPSSLAFDVGKSTKED